MNINYKEIVRLEKIVEKNIPANFEKVSDQYLNSINNWIDFIYYETIKLSDYETDKANLEKGLSISKNAIFICGAARSGTTFYKNLISGNKEIFSLHTEIGFARNFWKQKTNENFKKTVLKYYFYGLVKGGINIKTFIFGRSNENYSPYVEFTRYFFTWFKIIKEKNIHELSALALAHISFLGNGKIDSNIKYWLDKTPFSELFLKNIFLYYPDAKIIMLYRNPINVYASLKKITSNIDVFTKKQENLILINLYKSHKLISEIKYEKQKNVFLVKYENLLKNKEEIQKQIAEFLNIKYDEIMISSFSENMISDTNSSFSTQTAQKNKLKLLSDYDKKRISVIFKNTSKKLAYSLENVNLFDKITIKSQFCFQNMVLKIKEIIKKCL